MYRMTFIIYRIVGGGKTYYGKSRTKLSERKRHHKSEWKRWKNGKSHFVSSYVLFDEVGFENCVFDAIETYTDITDDELREREQWWIINNECVNMYNAKTDMIQWRKEYNKKNREYQSNYSKERRKARTPEQIEEDKQKKKEYDANRKKIRAEYSKSRREHINELQRIRRNKAKLPQQIEAEQLS